MITGIRRRESQQFCLRMLNRAPLNRLFALTQTQNPRHRELGVKEGGSSDMLSECLLFEELRSTNIFISFFVCLRFVSLPETRLFGYVS